MHDRLFGNQNALKPEDLLKHAEAIGADMSKFKACLDSGKYSDEIKKDVSEGQKVGVTGTPTSLIGWIQQDGKTIKAVKRLTGAQSYSVFKENIDSLLGSQK